MARLPILHLTVPTGLVTVLFLFNLYAAPPIQWEKSSESQESVTSQSAPPTAGLMTDRLSPKQLRIWRALEQIALARNGAGQPLRPVLYELHSWAQTSTIPIYIEMPKARGRWPYLAGECLFDEQGDTLNTRPAAVTIRLYTTVIEKAPSRGRDFESEQAFIPFKGLPREERYCETLAHELAHARQSVTDPGFLPMRDRLKSMNDQVLKLQSLRLVSSVKKEMQAIADQIKVLTSSIEGPAIAVERAVWRELSER